MRFILLAGLLALLIGCLSTKVGSSQVSETNGETSSDAANARGRFVLPRLFDFEHFKNLFKRHYGSLVEESARQRLYLGRAFGVFVSAVSYKHHRSTSYLSINHMSDWTLKEVKKLYLKPEVLDAWWRGIASAPSVEEEKEVEKVENNDTQIVPVADLADIRSKLTEIARNTDQSPGFRELVDELRPKRTCRCKRSTESPPPRHLSLDDLIRRPGSEESAELRGHSIESNNPNYQGPELSSFGSASDDKESVRELSKQEASLISSLPGSSFISSSLQAVSRMFTQTGGQQMSSPLKGFEKTNQQAIGKADEVRIDHRQGKCLTPVRSQENCGACYVFASITLYEWAYCMATGAQVAFSEQYVLDCGRRINMGGCEGDIFYKVGDFVRVFGLELRANYPYRGRQDSCPYNDLVPATSMGYMRVTDEGYEAFPLEQAETHLQSGPLMINLKLNQEFNSYGGGVDMGKGCSEAYMHSMVLVGSGRQDGIEYWLMRNSFSDSWGEKGYYKLRKNSGCELPKLVARFKVRFDLPAKGLNPNYDVAPVYKRYSDYKVFHERMDQELRKQRARQERGQKE